MSFNKKHLIFGGILILSLAVASFAFAQTTVNKDFNYTNTNYIYNLQGLSIGTSTINNNSITFSDGTVFNQNNAAAAWTTDATGIHYNSGNVGIGVTDPNSALDVNGAIYGSIFYDKDDTSYYVNPSGTSNLGGLINFGSGWSNSGGTQMGSDTSPSKGIEFDFDTDRWFLYGREDSGSSETNELVLRIADNSSDSFLIEGESGSTVSNIASFARNPGIDFYQTIDANSNKIINLATPTSNSDAANKSYVDSSISGGTTSNAERCDADGTCETNAISFSNDITYSNNDSFEFGFGNTYDPTIQMFHSDSATNPGGMELSMGENAAGYLAFGREGGGSDFDEYARFVQGGNFGIGTTNPDHKFDIEGTGGTLAQIRNTGTGEADIRYVEDGDANADWQVGTGYSGSRFGNDAFFFYNSGDRASLDSDGDFWASNSVRSPIFYDSNNTSYYMNPSGSSNLGGNIDMNSNDITEVDDLAVRKIEPRYRTSYTSNDNSGNWTRIISTNMGGATYAESDAEFFLIGESLSGTQPSSARIVLHISTHSDGTINSVDIIVSDLTDNNVFSKGDLKVVNVGSASNPTLELYLRQNANWQRTRILPINRMNSGGAPKPTFHHTDGFVTSLPSGTQYSARYAEGWFNTVNFDGQLNMNNNNIDNVNKIYASTFYDDDNTSYYVNPSGSSNFAGSINISQNNNTGGGLQLADDGDFVDLNDGYGTFRMADGIRITDAESGGNTAIQFGNGTSGGTHSYFNTGGNLGIGTSNPTSKLTVDQGGSGAWTAGLELDYDGSNEWLIVGDSTNGERLNFGYNSNSQFMIDSANSQVDLQNNALVDVNWGASDNPDTTVDGCSNCLSTGEISDVYVLNSGDTMTGTLDFDSSETGGAIADTFGSATTRKNRISFDAYGDSNDPGYIVHETTNASGYENKGVLHLAPTDDNSSSGDYVSIHGTNDPETIKIFTDGDVYTPGKITSPIMYDRDNTSYYANPASSSRLNQARLNHLGVGTSANTTYRIYATGDSYGIRAHGSTMGGRFEDSNSSARAYAGYGSYDILANGTGRIDATSQMRSPIYYDRNNTSYYINPSAGGTAAKLNGDISIDNPSGGATELRFRSGVNTGSDYGYIRGVDDYDGGTTGTSENFALVLRTENDGLGSSHHDDIVLDAAAQVRVMSRMHLEGNDIVGVDKLDANTVDPVYQIDNKKYATYMAGMTGVKEETTGSVQLTKNKQDYTHIIDFQNLEKGSDLWIFYQTSDFGENWNNLSVLLTGDASVKDTAYYKFLPKEEKLVFYGDDNGRVSYRLTAPRFDHDKWDNNYEGESEGLTVPAMK